MKVFIVGGTGFLGYYATLEFLRRGHQVDTISLPDIELGDWFPKEVGVKYGNVFEMPHEELTELFQGYDGMVYAVGPDDRYTPDAPAYDFFYKKVYGLVVGSIYNRARFILVTGKQIFDDVSKGYRKVFQTVPSVSFKNFDRQESKAAVNITDRPINLFFAGPINERKGIVYLIRGVSQLIKKGMRVQLYLAGTIDNPYKKLLDYEISKNKLIP